MTFSMTCTCGDIMTIEADTREEAVVKMKEAMSEEAVSRHSAEKHPNQPTMTITEIHSQIEQNMQPV